MRSPIGNPFRPGGFLAIGVGLLLVGAIALAGYFLGDFQPPLAESETQCAQSPETIEPTLPWRFQTDPGDVGVVNRWFDVGFDDSEWNESPPGEAWRPEYVGVAWYRATFTLPAEWGIAYLGVAQVDDKAELWVDGARLDWDPASGDASQIIQLAAGQTLQLAFRIVNNGGPGGIKQPVKIARTPWAALPPESYVRWLAAEHPEWPMPGWTRNGYYAWTFTGLPGLENRALFGADGAVAPWPAAPNVSLLVYDPASGALAIPKPTFSLVDKSLPIPQAAWEAAGLSFNSTLFRAPGSDAIRLQVTMSNGADNAINERVLAVIRPLGFNPSLRPTYAAGFDRDGRLWLNGQPFMQASPLPAQYGVGTLAEVLEATQTGSIPNAQNLPCAPAGDAAALMAFDVRLQPGEGLDLSLSFPADPGAPFPMGDAKAGLREAREAWREAIGAPSIVIPDQEIVNAYQTSIGYLLLALSPNGPRPGPLEHAKVWVRDAAFVGEALLAAGHGARVESYLPALFAHQAADGRIPAIIGRDGPEPVDEWDAQGQAIFLVAAIYRYERDLSFLKEWEPRVKGAAEFLRKLRAQTQNDPTETRGLLPPSRSAEDLGPADWHHYWDDFWGVAGLSEAAFIERQLGHTDDANWMSAEADALREAIRASITSVMGPEPDYIPGAPEEIKSSAMARGTSVSLFPVEVLPKEDPLVTRSFATYYDKWIAPSDGGYVHIWGQWWPYGGLGLARDYLRLGQQTIVHQILAWTLSHQTLPGTYAWAEQVSPTHGGISGGDMPHAWAASAYATLIREMLVMRQGEKLELFAGVPASWLAAGKVVGVKAAPTEFGILTALVESDIDTGRPDWEGMLTLKIEGSARPSEGFGWKLPRTPSSIDGPPGVEIRDGRLVVPSDGGVVKLRYGIRR